MMNSDSLMPHAVCWATDPKLIWTMVVTNFITFLSYLTICVTLLYLVRRTRRIVVGDWAYFVVGFALFIVACGLTHLLEVITTWNPIFWVDAWTNIVTALLSACVAVMLIQCANKLAFGINDYAERLDNTELEKEKMRDSLMAAQKLEDWSRMSAVVSHEIKNPLQAIQNLQFLIGASEGVSKEVAELARMAGEEAQRVLTIADSSLSFIRQAKEPELIDLSAAVESVRFLLNPLMQKKRIQFHLQHSGDCRVQALAGETRQVLLNVIRNACDSITEPEAKIDVELAGTEAGVKVAVIDQGSGIDPEIVPQLFKFGVTSKGQQGNGMGLWTVKHILDKHLGAVKIESVPGRGTRVELQWPKAYHGPVHTLGSLAG